MQQGKSLAERLAEKRINLQLGKIRRPGVVLGPGKVIITGVGRSGTTFLTHLLTALGIPTGFSLSECLSSEKSPCRAGLERAGSPLCSYVSKDPRVLPLNPGALGKGGGARPRLHPFQGYKAGRPEQDDHRPGQGGGNLEGGGEEGE